MRKRCDSGHQAGEAEATPRRRWRSMSMRVMRDARRARGQATLEYTLIIAAVIAAVAVAATTLVKPAVNKTMTDTSDMMQNASGKMKTGLGL